MLGLMAGSAAILETQAMANTLDYFMTALEITNAELQRRMNILSDSTVARWRKGERQFGFPTTMEICEKLDIDPVVFFEVAVDFARGIPVAA